MAHCPPELLDDVADVLVAVRAWPGILEKKPGVFYLGREPFLHFHLLEGGRRRADVKERAGWTQVDLQHRVSAMARRTLQRVLRLCYREKQLR